MKHTQWVEDEIWNWSRMHWEGDYPGPKRIKEDAGVCDFPLINDDDEVFLPLPVNYKRARVVESVYKELPLNEKKIIHSEYTKIKKYRNLCDDMRAIKASENIGISLLYYKLALNDFKEKVRRVFS